MRLTNEHSFAVTPAHAVSLNCRVRGVIVVSEDGVKYPAISPFFAIDSYGNSIPSYDLSYELYCKSSAFAFDDGTPFSHPCAPSKDFVWPTLRYNPNVLQDIYTKHIIVLKTGLGNRNVDLVCAKKTALSTERVGLRVSALQVQPPQSLFQIYIVLGLLASLMSLSTLGPYLPGT